MKNLITQKEAEEADKKEPLKFSHSPDYDIKNPKICQRGADGDVLDI